MLFRSLREYQRERYKAYYLKNKEAVRERAKRYVLENRSKVQVRKQEYYLLNKKRLKSEREVLRHKGEAMRDNESKYSLIKAFIRENQGTIAAVVGSMLFVLALLFTLNT